MSENPTTSAQVTPAAPDELAILLSGLDLTRIGDGSIYAGVSLLVVMCNALCALEGPDSRVIDEESGIPHATGVNLLCHDPVAVRVLQERVLPPIHRLQNFVLQRLHTMRRREARATPVQRSRADKMLFDVLKAPFQPFDETIAPLTPPDFFEENETVRRELASTHPRFVAAGTKSKDVEADLAQAHMGHVLMCPVFSRIEEVEAMDTVLNDVMSRSHRPSATKDHPFPGCTGGRVVVSITPPIQEALTTPGLCSATWHTRVVWLPRALYRDGEPLRAPQSTTNIKLFNLLGHYEAALKRVLNPRLGGEALQPPKLRGAHRIHSRILRAIRLIPGITLENAEQFAALFVTLYRGFQLMVNASGQGWPASVTYAGLEALTVTLATNSVRELQFFEQRGKIAQRREEVMRVYEKLADGPQTPRELCRRFHRLNVKEGVAILHLLESWGLVTVADGHWQHAETTEDPRRVIETAVIEIP
jgi:hypothetical protein